MELIAPVGTVYQAGTLSGNPLAMAAGVATLTPLVKDGGWQQAADATEAVAAGVSEAAAAAGIPVWQNRVGTMFSTFFTASPVTDWESASRADRGRYGAFFRSMLDGGVYLAPSPFEAGFLSTAHDDEAINLTRAAAATAFASFTS